MEIVSAKSSGTWSTIWIYKDWE